MWHHLQNALLLYIVYRTTFSVPLIKMIMRKVKYLDKKGLVFFALATLVLSSKLAYLICYRDNVKKILLSLIQKCFEEKKTKENV